MTNATEIIFDLKATGLGIGTNHFAPPAMTFQFGLRLKNFYQGCHLQTCTPCDSQNFFMSSKI